MSHHNSTICGGTNRVITYREILDLQKARAGYIIDVRDPKEVRETGTLPNAVNIPLNELQDALNMSYNDFECKYKHDKPGPHSKIIFTCKSGNRSGQALRIALAMGYTDPYNYVGGWNDWESHLRGEKSANKCSSD